jgi:hypothetical protein
MFLGPVPYDSGTGRTKWGLQYVELNFGKGQEEVERNITESCFTVDAQSDKQLAEQPLSLGWERGGESDHLYKRQAAQDEEEGQPLAAVHALRRRRVAGIPARHDARARLVLAETSTVNTTGLGQAEHLVEQPLSGCSQAAVLRVIAQAPTVLVHTVVVVDKDERHRIRRP